METAVTIGGFVIGLVTVWLAVTARFERRLESFVRKDVDAVEKKALADSLADIKQLVTDTKHIVTTEMPKAIEKACIAGVDAGARLQKRQARLPIGKEDEA